MELSKKSSALFGYGQGDHDRIRMAIYITGANVAVLLAGLALIALYWVLETFFRPLMWAMLCGAFLHPFKYRVARNVKSWLDGLKSTGTPISLGLMVVPLTLLNVTAEQFVTMIYKRWRVICAVSLLYISLYFVYHHTPMDFRQLYGCLVSVISVLLRMPSALSLKWILALDIIYLSVVVKFWSAENRRLLSFLSLPVWFFTAFAALAILGPLKVPFIMGAVALILVGFSYNPPLESSDVPDSGHSTTTVDPNDVSIMQHLHNISAMIMDSFNENSSVERSDEPTNDSASTTLDTNPNELNGDNENVAEAGADVPKEASEDTDVPKEAPEKALETSDKIETVQADSPIVGDTPGVDFVDQVSQTPIPPRHSKASRLAFEDPSDKSHSGTETSKRKPSKRKSDRFFLFLFWSITLVILWRNIWLLALSPVLALVLIAKRFGRTIGEYLVDYLTAIRPQLQPYIVWCKERLEVIIPQPVRNVTKLVLRGDRQIVNVLINSADTIISIAFILLLFIGVALFSIYMCFQLQKEGIHLVTLTSNLVQNSSIANAQWVEEYFPNTFGNDTNFRSNLNPMIKNVYTFGRGWIKGQVQQRVTHAPSAEVLETELLSVWDGLYASWLAKDSTSLLKPNYEGAIFSHIKDGGVDLMWRNAIDLQGIIDFIRENIGIFQSVIESVWILLKGNVNFAFTILFSSLQMVLGGGTALFNFTLSLIVFLTTLFYLLSSSSNTYKPVEWISVLTVAKTGGKFAKAVEDGIGGVFAASLKMATFYGLYTWLTHTMFGINIVYLPSAFAATLGAIPFVGAYWAAAPAILELSLVHGEIFLAVLLAFFHILPTLFVDAAIYSDIKGGGHPYLTGLAIAGGIYCFGLQGAIVGPVLLCGIIVAMNLYSAMINPDQPITASTPAAHSSKGLNRLNRSVSTFSI